MYKISVSLGAYQMRGILSVAFLFICFLYQKVTATGARVTTVSAGAHHTTSEEPEKITVKADPGTQLGVSFGDGGSVRQVALDILWVLFNPCAFLIGAVRVRPAIVSPYESIGHILLPQLPQH